jgi:hypothetical protein
MPRRLIRLGNKGPLVEVEVTENQAQQIAGGIAKTVDVTLDKVKSVLLGTCRPIVAAVKDLRTDEDLEQIEVEMGLSFDIEGNIYITKANFGASVLVRMTLKKGGEADE